MDAWRKSSYSGSNGGSCVETASTNGVVKVRDTTQNGLGPVVSFTASAWSAFTTTLKA